VKINFMKKYFLKILPLFLGLALFFTACIRKVNPDPGNIPDQNVAEAPVGDIVTTVANIINRPDGSIEYNFNERQAVFIVPANNPNFSSILSIAKEGLAGTKPVKLVLGGYNVLNNLIWPSAAETKIYLDWYKLKIVRPEPARLVRVSAIDTNVFNNVDFQNWIIFRSCTKVIPDYATAKKIFDYCAQQQCTFGPTQVQPCIPFQYVIDGCFARAHKMRSIIEGKYRYCSEKVFSYGDLNVKANKWGGCCVSWWYHVAPLVRVKTSKGTFCYVIDPGMFNSPVLLSTWLSAQENTNCSSGANVNRYSIQPSSAYTPEYTTDNNYSLTNNDLVYYNSLGPTCPNQ